MSDQDPLDDWFSLLVSCSENLDAEAAIALWQQAAVDHPDSALPYLMIGAEHAQSGATAEAEDAFSRALLIDPSLAIARFQLGLLQMCNNRIPAAVLTWQALGALDAENPLRLFAEGLTALAANQSDEALSKLQRGLIANEDNPSLNRDMQLVIDRINASTSTSDHTPADYHFLLANYREAGKLH
ncbi:MAG: hypothetical protein RIR70_1954 [Pseudomonadota bacterium]